MAALFMAVVIIALVRNTDGAVVVDATGLCFDKLGSAWHGELQAVFLKGVVSNIQDRHEVNGLAVSGIR
jgi:hypothetical protein